MLPVTHICFHPVAKSLVALTRGNMVFFLNVSTREKVSEHEAPALITSIAFSDDGEHLALGLADKSLTVLTKSGETVFVQSFERGAVEFVKFVNDYLIAVDARSAYSIDLRTQETTGLLGDTSRITCSLLSSDLRRFVFGNVTRQIRVTSFPDTYNIHTFCLGHREWTHPNTALSYAWRR